ncbi:MAG: SDR family oxidoreductase [Rhodospirillales bacterium]|nr:SDR family oxidoreductase [Rhodospirillales bacterium]MDE2199410.1 SDR family oxidoreductase [Rhodospirillales bacterium]MDE2574239.1 SDR family oxidoreductase [Rhodospirillales bacterium]
MRLKGRIALVIGAGSSGPGWGNGKAAAVQYAREGAGVVAVDLRGEAAEETASIIRGEGGEALALTGDVTNAADVERIVGETLARFGAIDILHNNVGITDMGDLATVTEEAWHRVMDVNLTSVFLTCRAVVPVMQRQHRGAIVNISSLAGAVINAYPYFSYYASKAGLNHFTRALAVRHAKDGIRANVVMPGVMNTPLIHSQISGQYADTAAMLAARDAMSPMGRMGDAWDVARAAAFLASDDASYITGVCLPVDGGLACLAQ